MNEPVVETTTLMMTPTTEPTSNDSKSIVLIPQDQELSDQEVSFEPNAWYGEPMQVTLIGIAIISIASALCSLLCLQFFITLNVFLKNTLKAVATLLMISNSIIIAGFALMLEKGGHGFLNCSLVIWPSMFILEISLNIPMVISIVRYYMTWKASKAEIAEPSYLIGFIVANFTLVFFSVLGNAIIVTHFNVSSMVFSCANIDDVEEWPPIIPGLQFMKYFLQIGISGYFDWKLIKFIENKNALEKQKNEQQLVPWKSGEGSTILDVGIPVRATYISFGFFVLLTIMLICFMIFWYEEPRALPWICMTILLWSVVHLPLILIFTVRHHFKVKSTSQGNQPPKGLMFHDAPKKSATQEESGVCNNPVFTIDVAHENGKDVVECIEDFSHAKSPKNESPTESVHDLILECIEDFGNVKAKESHKNVEESECVHDLIVDRIEGFSDAIKESLAPDVTVLGNVINESLTPDIPVPMNVIKESLAPDILVPGNVKDRIVQEIIAADVKDIIEEDVKDIIAEDFKDIVSDDFTHVKDSRVIKVKSAQPLNVMKDLML